MDKTRKLMDRIQRKHESLGRLQRKLARRLGHEARTEGQDEAQAQGQGTDQERKRQEATQRESQEVLLLTELLEGSRRCVDALKRHIRAYGQDPDREVQIPEVGTLLQGPEEGEHDPARPILDRCNGWAPVDQEGHPCGRWEFHTQWTVTDAECAACQGTNPEGRYVVRRMRFTADEHMRTEQVYWYELVQDWWRSGARRTLEECRKEWKAKRSQERGNCAATAATAGWDGPEGMAEGGYEARLHVPEGPGTPARGVAVVHGETGQVLRVFDDVDGNAFEQARALADTLNGGHGRHA